MGLQDIDPLYENVMNSIFGGKTVRIGKLTKIKLQDNEGKTFALFVAAQNNREPNRLFLCAANDAISIGKTAENHTDYSLGEMLYDAMHMAGVNVQSVVKMVGTNENQEIQQRFIKSSQSLGIDLA